MLNTLEDVSGNTYVNRFVDIANSYGLEGVYIKYRSSATQQDEVYFVCGLDKQKVCEKGLDVESIFTNRQKNYRTFNPYIAAFKITGGDDPILTHRTVVEYCQTAEFLDKLYKEHDMQLPRHIPHGLISGLKMAHQNANNPRIDEAVRNIYKKDIRDTLRKQDRLFTEHAGKLDKARYYLYWQYDSQKSRLANWLKRTFSRDKNKVSMAHLVYTCKETATIGVHISDRKKVQVELRKHPEIIYWMAKKPIGQKIRCPDDQGYGSSKGNDRRYIPIAFDREYGADVLGIVNKVEHPDAYKTTPREMVKTFRYVMQISIASDDYDKYTSAMRNRGIRYCIHNTSTDPSVINLYIGCDIKQNLTDILGKLSSETETTHLYKDIETRQESAFEDFMSAQREKAEANMFQQVQNMLISQNGSADIEMIKSSGDMLGDDPFEI